MKFVGFNFMDLNFRQGSMIIATVQMILSGYILSFAALGVRHLLDIQDMIDKDTEDALEREALEEITSQHINSHRMELAHHNATEEMYMMYCGIVVNIIHFTSTILLFYGAWTNKRYLMAPWMMIMMTIIVAAIISLFLVDEDCPFIAAIGGGADLVHRMLIGAITMACVYMWLIIYSHYRCLEMEKGLIHEVHGTKKNKSMTISSVNKKSQNLWTPQTVPLPPAHEV